MSFTSEMKRELTQQKKLKTCCQRAVCSALVRLNGSIQISDGKQIVEISTENPSTARFLFSLLKDLYQLHPEVLVRKKSRLKKNYVYMIRLTNRVKEVLVDLKIFTDELKRVSGISPNLIKKACCKRAYLRGAFLASGSVNDPDSGSYHLEIISTYYDHCEALCELMNQFHLHAKTIERKKGYVVYVKEGDKIGEFLNIIGAHPSLLHFENVRIMKDMRNSVNRIVNCETANLNRTIQAAIKQVENIRLIEEELGLEHLNDKLQEVAKLRLQYPEASLAELGQLLPGRKMTKSAMNHRLRKLNQIAEKIRQKKNSQRRDQNG